MNCTISPTRRSRRRLFRPAARRGQAHQLDPQEGAELDLKLDKKQLKLEVESGEVSLRMRHQVTVDLSVHTWVWDYDETFTHLRM